MNETIRARRARIAFLTSRSGSSIVARAARRSG
jgi:hypothetical protein